MGKLFQTILVVLLVALPLAYLAMVFPSLPAVIPTHFGFDGKPNGYSDKQDMIWIVMAISDSFGIGLFIDKVSAKG